MKRPELVEHALQMSGGGYHIRNQTPGVERVYPLQRWIEDNQRDGKVYRRTVIVVDDWHAVPPAAPSGVFTRDMLSQPARPDADRLDVVDDPDLGAVATRTTPGGTVTTGADSPPAPEPVATVHYRAPEAPDDECGEFLTMWDGEYESYCVRDPGHRGRHWGRYAAWNDHDDIQTGCVHP